MNSHHCERSPRDASSRTWLPRSLESHAPELRRLNRWLDSWSGVGHIVAGMARQGYDLELRRYDDRGWRAMFFSEGFEHSLTLHAGAAWARSASEAVERAAVDALGKLEGPDPAPRDWSTTDETPR